MLNQIIIIWKIIKKEGFNFNKFMMLLVMLFMMLFMMLFRYVRFVTNGLSETFRRGAITKWLFYFVVLLGRTA